MTGIELVERRKMLARATLTVLDKNGPLDVDEKRLLTGLERRLNMVEREIDVETLLHDEEDFTDFLRHSLFRSPQLLGMSRERRSRFEARQKERRDVSGGGGQQEGLGGGAYPGSAGGVFVPVGFVAQVTAAAKFEGPMLRVSPIIDSATGAPLPYPQADDRSVSGEQISESTTVSEQVVDLSQVVLGSFKYSSRAIKLSIELAADTGFDISSWLASIIGTRLGRILNLKFTTGTGSGEPLGIATAADAVVTAIGSASNDGTGGANTIGSDDVANLIDAVDVAYHPAGLFMAHPKTILSLRKVKDRQGLPVFPGLHSGERDTIFNFPIIPNPNMAQLQASPSSPVVARKTLLFGDFSKYAIRRTPLMVMDLIERFAEFGQRAFIGFQRFDGALVDGGGQAVRALQNIY